MKIFIFNIVALIIVIYNATDFACTSEPIVNTQNGKLKGAKVIGSEGDEFYSFKGIPFAKPPVGELRFSDPEPAESWTGIREATAYGAYCVQHDWFINKILGKEDCLYLNVFTKSTDDGIKRPVMVWIHGGAFVCGSGDDMLYGPDYFMRKDNIVLVTINYRVGIFGFMTLNDEVATGNQGLKDQVLALQWVRDNIANFGGDPNQVTIFGESAGGASVHLLTISPLARGLFHKAIIQSGVAINPWSYQLNSEKRVYEICNKLGHTDKDPKSIVQFLRTIDAKELLKSRKDLITKEDIMQYNVGFGPCIDSKSKKPFMPIHPENATDEGVHVPLMIGHTSREGILFTKLILEIRDQLNKGHARVFHENVINTLKIYGLTVECLKRIYFKDELITQQNIDKLIDLLGDLFVIEGTHRVIKVQIQKQRSPTYYYQFTYDQVLTSFKLVLGSTSSGASHADELFYLFRHEGIIGTLEFPKKGSERYRIMEQMIEMWVNFATTGTPTVKPSELLPFQWDPVNNDNETVFSYLNICENPRMESALSMELKYTAK